MEEKPYNNVFAIPANYTDSGKILGGMLELRNTVEASFLLILAGYPELMWLPVTGTIKIVVMTVTLLPWGCWLSWASTAIPCSSIWATS